MVALNSEVYCQTEMPTGNKVYISTYLGTPCLLLGRLAQLPLRAAPLQVVLLDLETCLMYRSITAKAFLFGQCLVWIKMCWCFHCAISVSGV